MKQVGAIFIVLVLFGTALQAGTATKGQPESVPGQVILGLEAGYKTRAVGADPLTTVLQKYSGRLLDQIVPGKKGMGISSVGAPAGIALLQFAPGTNLEAARQELSSLRGVQYAEPNYYVYADTESSPIKVGNVTSCDISAARLVPSASVQDVIVGVLDTGVDYRHQDLSAHMWHNFGEVPGNGRDDDGNGYIDDVYGYDFCNYSRGGGSSDPIDSYGHGTHVAGIVLSAANSQREFICKDINVKIMALKFLDANGRGTQYDAACAFYYAADNGARVINCSWGYFASSVSLFNAVDYAVRKGVIIVASSGNNNWDYEQYPACFPHVLSVGAIDNNGKRAYFSNYGDYLFISAPGVDILSTYPGNAYAKMTGTSQASPYVAGVVAMLQATSALSNDQLLLTMKSSAIDMTDPDGSGATLSGWDRLSGWGKVNPYGSLVAALGSQVVVANKPLNSAAGLSLLKVLNYPNPAKVYTEFGFEVGNQPANVSITVYDLYGKKVRALQAFPYSQGVYSKRAWDLTDENGQDVPNGTYLYVVKAVAPDGSSATQKQKLAVLR